MARVYLLGEVGNLREWRFVPKNWRDPFSHHRWFLVTDEELIAAAKDKLKDHPPVTWYRRPHNYVVEISYHPDIRPWLVVVGGLL